MIQENSSKLKGRVFRISKRVKSCPGAEDYPVYGVTNKEGVIITGKDASFNLENYIVVQGQKFVYNPYRINVGSIGLTGKDFQGIVSPAYVVFEVKDIIPEVLFTFLKSDKGNRLINWYGNHGSVRKALRFSDLEKIDFPEIDKERQLQIAKKFSITADTVKLFNSNNNFDFKHIQKLRQAILSEAIQGELVPQHSNDEPASVLLDKIKAEKKKLIEEKKIKKEKPLPPITKDEIPFSLPKGWIWCRLGEIGFTNIGLTYSPSDISTDGTPVLRANNIQNGIIDLDDLVRVKSEVSEKNFVNLGDIIICARNGSRRLVGKAAIIKELPEKMAFGAFMAVFRSSCNKYIKIFIDSPAFRSLIDEVNTTTINQITQSNLRNTLMPLPPFNEQKRIVEKVDELMGLCGALENQVKENKANSEKLMDSILREAFEHAA